MIKYYLLITSGAVLDGSSKFYKVGVGNSQRDKLALNKLREFAAANGYYFSLYDNDAAEFLYNIAKSFGCQVYHLPTRRYSIRDMIGFAIDGKTIHDPDFVLPQVSYMRSYLEPAFYFQQKRSVIHHAESGTRIKPKVYSDRPQRQLHYLFT